MSIEATTVVSFNTGDTTAPYSFTVELDSELNTVKNEEVEEFQSSPYLQILTKYWYPKNTSPDVDEEGNKKTTISTFPPGADVIIAINKSSNVTIDEVRTTDGKIALHREAGRSTVSREGSSTNLFKDLKETLDDDEVRTDKYTLEYIPGGSVDISYIGNGGRVTEEETNIGTTSYYHNVDYVPFIAQFDYEYDCILYKLESPTMVIGVGETTPIGIVFYITVSEG